MKFKLMAVTSCIIFSTAVQSQNFLLSLNTGIAQGETKYFKKNMFSTAVHIGYEAKIRGLALMSSEIGLSQHKYDFIDTAKNQVFIERMAVSVITKFKKPVFYSSSRNHFWFAFGIAASFGVRDKNEIYTFGVKRKTSANPKGYNIAILSDIGYRFILTEKASISLSLQMQSDFIQNYKSENDKIKYDKTLCSITYFHRVK
jgi:hypothetical protein